MKFLLIIFMIIFLSGCTFVVGIDGIPHQISVERIFPVASPTEEYATSIYTPVPTTTATPLPTVTPFICSVTADSNINMRLVPGGTFLFLIDKGTTLYPNAYTYYKELKYYRFDLPVDDDNPYSGGWAADYFTENGNCGVLQLENPFLK